MTGDISIHQAVEADWDAFYRCMSDAFNEDVDEESAAAERLVFEPERALVARRGNDIVGTAGILTRQLTVPGGVVPAAHVTFVTVAATARRQGVLTRMMKRQFADAAAAGEPVAVLWASESRIYQRFGYGIGARRLGFTIDSREISLTVPSSAKGVLREGTPQQLRDAMVAVYEMVRLARPGWSQRDPRHWDYRLTDPASGRRGSSSMRALCYDGPEGPEGYALFRVTGKWDESGPAGEVRLGELVAATPDAYASLWRFFLTLDLTRSVEAWIASIDEPLFFMVNEPRRLQGRLTESLWVRLLDVGAALSVRRYATPIDVVIDVTDEMVPANSGRWRLTGSTEQAACVPTTEDPDFACDVRVLGAAYLGAAPLVALAAAGLVTQLRPDVLATASTAFGWPQAPSAIEVF
jgi:predicted acetyltransferase